MRQESKPFTLIDFVLATTISGILLGFFIQQLV